MKKNILLLLFISLNFSLYSQNFEELFNRIEKFDTQEQYDQVDPEILVAVNYLLSQPYKENSKSYFFAYKSMMKWMNDSTKYHIVIGGKIMEDCGKGNLMVNMYMASMSKYLLIEHLENNRYVHPVKKEGIKYNDLDEVKEILFNGAEIFMEYLKGQRKSVINKSLKKALKNYEKGNLKEYMFG